MKAQIKVKPWTPIYFEEDVFMRIKTWACKKTIDNLYAVVDALDMAIGIRKGKGNHNVLLAWGSDDAHGPGDGACRYTVCVTQLVLGMPKKPRTSRDIDMHMRSFTYRSQP